jgi:hypothetical protein
MAESSVARQSVARHLSNGTLIANNLSHPRADAKRGNLSSVA